MSAAARPPLSSDWRDIASLGEQIVSSTSLATQRDYIIAMASRLVKGEVDVWFDEKVFRLPNLEEENLFPEQPALKGLQRALKNGKACTRQRRAKNSESSVPRETWAAVPMIEQGVVLGALQVTRKKVRNSNQVNLNYWKDLPASSQ